MNKQIESIKKLKEIQLHYEDGSIISVPEDKTYYVGSMFMKILEKGLIDWKIVKKSDKTLITKIKDFFNI